jgi:hypothetical protein
MMARLNKTMESNCRRPDAGDASLIFKETASLPNSIPAAVAYCFR